MMNRRSALKALAAGAALPLAAGPVRAAQSSLKPGAKVEFRLGIATISLAGLPLENALTAVKRLGLEDISLFRVHSPWTNQPAQWRETAERIRAAGVNVRCCGVLYLKNDEASARHMMEYVQALGLSLFSCNIEPAGLPLLEKLVKEYNFRAAIHNHGPEDKLWPGAKTVWDAIQSFDPRVGLCLDTGHSYRAGEDPAEIIRRYRSRVFDVHLKDSAANPGEKDIPVEIGRGKMNLSNILTALIETGYRENVWFEYEKDPNDPIPGLAESVGYVRGLLRGLSAS